MPRSLAYHRFACALVASMALAATAPGESPRPSPAGRATARRAVEPPQLLPASASTAEAVPITARPQTEARPLTADHLVAPQSATSSAALEEAARETVAPEAADATDDPATANRGGALPLPRRQSRAPGGSAPGLPAGGTRARQFLGASPSWVTVAGSLSLVVGVFLVVAWALRRSGAAGAAALPGDVIEVLGRAPLPGRQQSMQLIRCGNKLVLVALSQGGADTLTEITDPEEVQRLAGLCRQAQPHSTTQAFQQVLEQLGNEPHAPGFLGDLASSRAGARRAARGTAAREATYG